MVMSVRTTILLPLTATPTMVIVVRLTMDRVTPIVRITTLCMTVIMSIMGIALLLAMIVAISLLLTTIIIPPSLRVIMYIRVGCYIIMMVMNILKGIGINSKLHRIVLPTHRVIYNRLTL